MYHLDNVTIGVNPPLIFVSLCKMKMFHTHERERESVHRYILVYCFAHLNSLPSQARISASNDYHPREVLEMRTVLQAPRHAPTYESALPAAMSPERQAAPPSNTIPSSSVASNLNFGRTLSGNFNSAGHQLFLQRQHQQHRVNVQYKGLGSHLLYCEQRNERAYGQYLAHKSPMLYQPRMELSSPEVNSHLHLPNTQEGWEAANNYSYNSLVPAVLNASSISEKYSILTDGVCSYFESSCGTEPVRKRPKKQRPLHDTSLKELTRKKKLAKQELHRARQQGFPTEVIQSLSRQFFTLVRSHSKLKKSANGRSAARNVRQVRSQCQKQFARYARELFDNGASSNVTPNFDAEKAHHFFSTLYQSGPKSFVKPVWMTSPTPPEVEILPLRSRGSSRR